MKWNGELAPEKKLKKGKGWRWGNHEWRREEEWQPEVYKGRKRGQCGGWEQWV